MLNKEQYLTVKNTWKQVKEHNIFEHVVYNVLRGVSADEGFAPITDLGKLNASQNNPHYMFNFAVRELHYMLNSNRYNFEKTVTGYSETFGIEFTADLIASVLEKIKSK